MGKNVLLSEVELQKFGIQELTQQLKYLVDLEKTPQEMTIPFGE